MRVLLIAGGWSSEREVAFSGARGIEASLCNLGHEIVHLDPLLQFDTLAETAAGCDFAFIIMHGSPGEDGLVQAILDAVGVPYQGAGPKGSFLALHKAASKQLFRQHGLPTPDWEFLPRRPENHWCSRLRFPIYVKDNTGGSSLGLGRVTTQEELRAACDTFFSKGREVLLEEGIAGIELTCGVLGEQALPPILIRPLLSDAFFDYQSKYSNGGAEELCPAPLESMICKRLQEYALTAHKALGLEGCSRADFIMHDCGLYLLEVNTIPGMTPTSLLPKAAKAAGLDFDALINRLLELGLQSHARKTQTSGARTS